MIVSILALQMYACVYIVIDNDYYIFIKHFV